MINIEKLRTIRKCLVNSRWSIDDILNDLQNDEKANKHMDFLIMSSEIVIGNAYDIKRNIVLPQNEKDSAETLKIDIAVTPENWLNLRINSILPSNKLIGSAKRLERLLKSALNEFSADNCFPKFDKAFLVIIEHCNNKTCKSFDHDNKNLRVIPNCLKGIVFPDDNQFQLSIAISAAYDDAEAYCDIYVLPHEMISIFAEKHLNSL